MLWIFCPWIIWLSSNTEPPSLIQPLLSRFGDFMSANRSRSLSDFTPEVSWKAPSMDVSLRFLYKRDVTRSNLGHFSLNHDHGKKGGMYICCFLTWLRFSQTLQRRWKEEVSVCFREMVRYEYMNSAHHIHPTPEGYQFLDCTPSSSIITMAGHQYLPRQTAEGGYCENPPPVTVDTRPGSGLIDLYILHEFWVRAETPSWLPFCLTKPLQITIKMWTLGQAHHETIPWHKKDGTASFSRNFSQKKELAITTLSSKTHNMLIKQKKWYTTPPTSANTWATWIF